MQGRNTAPVSDKVKVPSRVEGPRRRGVKGRRFKGGWGWKGEEQRRMGLALALALALALVLALVLALALALALVLVLALALALALTETGPCRHIHVALPKRRQHPLEHLRCCRTPLSVGTGGRGSHV